MQTVFDVDEGELRKIRDGFMGGESGWSEEELRGHVAGAIKRATDLELFAILLFLGYIEQHEL